MPIIFKKINYNIAQKKHKQEWKNILKMNKEIGMMLPKKELI